MAQLYLKQDKAQPARQSLELALSHNFEVKETPQYYIIKSRVHEQLGEYEEQIKVLESAMDLRGVRPESQTSKYCKF